MGDRLMIGEYQMDEVSSALQKEIRRGNEVDAMYWATQFIKNNFVKFLWRRLAVIASEDCSDEALQYFHHCHYVSNIAMNGKATECETNAVAKLIIYMCRSPKTREGCDLDWLVQKKIKDGWKLEVPDYALDSHTDRGRKMGRRGLEGTIFFATRGAKLDREYPSAYKKKALIEEGFSEEDAQQIMDAGTEVKL